LKDSICEGLVVFCAFLSLRVAEVVDGFAQTLFRRNARLPTEKAPDLGDVGLPLFRLASGSGF
jgi:hypothetical protein